jgi:ATP-dependent DNA helicase RecQ
MQTQALRLLRQALGDDAAVFRYGQWQAISALVQRKARRLVVERTGWGKSLVYFLATKFLRDQGAGCTLLISPERLANDDFVNRCLLPIANRVGLFVVDEAHCISDWGHDFRPNYRRIVRILRALPRTIPVLATTATANDRVVGDIVEQLGPNLEVQRGPLTRASLSLQNINLRSQEERMAWLTSLLPELPGSGIVYTLTVSRFEAFGPLASIPGN